MGKKSRKKQEKRNQTQKQAPEAVSAERQPLPVIEESFSRNILWQGILACLLAYASCLALRLLEVPAWEAGNLQFQGGKLMATHDAYYWLAGADKINRVTNHFLSLLVRFLHNLTGMKVANVGF